MTRKGHRRLGENRVGFERAGGERSYEPGLFERVFFYYVVLGRDGGEVRGDEIEWGVLGAEMEEMVGLSLAFFYDSAA